MRGEAYFGQDPETLMTVGEARLQGLKKRQKEAQESADEAALSCKRGRIHSPLTCFLNTWSTSWDLQQCKQLNPELVNSSLIAKPLWEP